MSTEFELPELKQAIGRLDDLFATAFSSKDNAMQDWVAVRYAIKAQSAPSNSDYEKLKGAIESIADYGGCLTGEDAQEMKQIAIKALQ